MSSLVGDAPSDFSPWLRLTGQCNPSFLPSMWEHITLPALTPILVFNAFSAISTPFPGLFGFPFFGASKNVFRWFDFSLAQSIRSGAFGHFGHTCTYGQYRELAWDPVTELRMSYCRNRGGICFAASLDIVWTIAICFVWILRKLAYHSDTLSLITIFWPKS